MNIYSDKDEKYIICYSLFWNHEEKKFQQATLPLLDVGFMVSRIKFIYVKHLKLPECTKTLEAFV